FLAMLGHELRNPLGAIVASAHVLRLAQPGDESAAKAQGVIDRQARQMVRLTEDLMDVSRLAMGKVTLQRQHLDLAALVRGVLQPGEGRARSGAARVQAQLATAWVYADPTRMEQVLGNLLDNAEKFSPPGSPIHASVRVSGTEAVLEVRDQGHGITAQDLP